MYRSLIAVVFLAASMTGYAQEDLPIKCSVAGYLDGQQKTFYADLVMGALSRDGFWESAACKEGVKEGRAAALLYEENGEPKNEKDRTIAQQAAMFKVKIRRFILEGAGL